MHTELVVTFPEKKKVNAEYKGFTIKTDQPPKAGGDGTAPTPFDLFLASIGLCGGIYVVDFCSSRGIPLTGARIVESIERDEETHMVTDITLRIELPKDFPDKYLDSLIRSVDLCTVKNHIMNPPTFAIQTLKVG